MIEHCPQCNTHYLPNSDNKDCPHCSPTSQTSSPSFWEEIDEGWDLTEEVGATLRKVILEATERENSAMTSHTFVAKTESAVVAQAEQLKRSRRTRTKAKRGTSPITIENPPVRPQGKPNPKRNPKPSSVQKATSKVKKRVYPPWLFPLLVFFAAILVLILALIASKSK